MTDVIKLFALQRAMDLQDGQGQAKTGFNRQLRSDARLSKLVKISINGHSAETPGVSSKPRMKRRGQCE
eukprot:9930665-Karenia_brevis.AAC.1